MKQLTGQSLDEIMHNKIFQESHLLGVCKLAERSLEVAPSISVPFYFGEVNENADTGIVQKMLSEYCF